MEKAKEQQEERVEDSWEECCLGNGIDRVGSIGGYLEGYAWNGRGLVHGGLGWLLVRKVGLAISIFYIYYYYYYYHYHYHYHLYQYFQIIL